jgi:diaminopimelate decarboxylase
MTPERRRLLDRIAHTVGTPCYVYFAEAMRRRFDVLAGVFGGRLGISYAVKSNPNGDLLKAIRDKVETLDISSIGEADRAIAAGYPADMLTFSGPAKRYAELSRAVELGVGEMVCESTWEMDTLNQLAAAAGRRVPVFVRINPSDMPRKFGVNMAGKPSQFGIDEEDLDRALDHLNGLENLQPAGFHIYSGTNCLDEAAIAENFDILIDLFTRAARSSGIEPRKLIFGSGFGIPYLPDEQELDIERLAALITPKIDALREVPQLLGARTVLEMGRWLVGPDGYLLTSVINEKTSRGTEIRMCDAGFNNHLGACGMMGTIIRRNWRFWKVSDGVDDSTREYLLVGPLCTTIDMLANRIELPPLARGDVLAIGMSGAYGLTASPTRFISHPEPHEVVVEGEGEDPVLHMSQSAGVSAIASHEVRLSQAAPA